MPLDVGSKEAFKLPVVNILNRNILHPKAVVESQELTFICKSHEIIKVEVCTNMLFFTRTRLVQCFCIGNLQMSGAFRAGEEIPSQALVFARLAAVEVSLA